MPELQLLAAELIAQVVSIATAFCALQVFNIIDIATILWEEP